MGTYKTCVLLGTIIMGIGSFTACLAQDSAMIAAGNAALLVAIAVMSYGFSKWQP